MAPGPSPVAYGADLSRSAGEVKIEGGAKISFHHRRYFSPGGAALPRRLTLREQWGGPAGGGSSPLPRSERRSER